MACAIRGLCSWKVFLVVLVVVAGNSVAAAALIRYASIK
jgi:hypothetical protein